MKKDIYIVVSGPLSYIEEFVNNKIKEGYLPIGGICANTASGRVGFYQAMVLKQYAV